MRDAHSRYCTVHQLVSFHMRIKSPYPHAPRTPLTPGPGQDPAQPQKRLATIPGNDVLVQLKMKKMNRWWFPIKYASHQSDDSGGPQNVFGSESRIPADCGFPEFLWDLALLLRGDGLPIGRGLGLEPVEIVDLVPLVVARVLNVCQLNKSNFVSFVRL